MQTKPQPPSVTSDNWRLRTGYLSEGDSDFESVHILIGQFLADRQSPDPLPETSLLAENGTFEWGQGKPLEKVINSSADLALLMQHPALFRNAIDCSLSIVGSVVVRSFPV